MPTYRFRMVGPREGQLSNDLGFQTAVEGAVTNSTCDIMIDDANDLPTLQEWMASKEPCYEYVGPVII